MGFDDHFNSILMRKIVLKRDGEAHENSNISP
jgi:hypothetical protein